MSCEGACAHAQVQCVVAHVHVSGKSILESVWDVHACGPFLTCSVRPHICTLLHTFWGQKMQLVLKTILELERPIPFWNIFFCFGTFFPDLEHLILFLNTKKT